MQHHSKDPLHGITLQMIVEHLVERYGWDWLGKRVPIKCFTNDPSVKSSLIFLRKTPWARDRVEALYIRSIDSQNKLRDEQYGDIVL